MPITIELRRTGGTNSSPSATAKLTTPSESRLDAEPAAQLGDRPLVVGGLDRDPVGPDRLLQRRRRVEGDDFAVVHDLLELADVAPADPPPPPHRAVDRHRPAPRRRPHTSYAVSMSIDDYVIGYCMRARSRQRMPASLIKKIAGRPDRRHPFGVPPDSGFEPDLEWLLDGIEASVGR